MNRTLRADADSIIRASISAVLPDNAVQRALRDYLPGPGKTLLVSVGKAAWQMAKAALDTLGRVDDGLVITKYGHSKGELPGVRCFEAGHPVPDENSFAATKEALALVSGLSADDTVIFLLSGGGSALFELPQIPIRKRLSSVKGGRFAKACAPARVLSIVLSDILGDPLDSIASGPAYPDGSTCADAMAVVEKYGLTLTSEALALLQQETPKSLDNVETQVNGSVRELCAAAAAAAAALGYEPVFLTDMLSCEAREAGRFLASILRSHANGKKSIAFIAGGETVVHLTGSGMGGRNQELALAACEGIAGLEGAAVFSVGSDGTDGPTDAAGGYTDSESLSAMQALGLNLHRILADNDAYHALQAIDGLIFTGPTGTNVNDVAVALLKV